MILELTVMIGMFLIFFAFNLSVLGVTISFVYFEIIRILTISLKGKIDSRFAKNYITLFFKNQYIKCRHIKRKMIK